MNQNPNTPQGYSVISDPVRSRSIITPNQKNKGVSNAQIDQLCDKISKGYIEILLRHVFFICFHSMKIRIILFADVYTHL
jgi:hypothetical protein